jgi:hypothetical protein
MFVVSFMNEIFLESVPQMIVQGINNGYTGQWSDPVNVISFTFSISATTSALYSILYRMYYENIELEDVPLELRIPCVKEPLVILRNDHTSDTQERKNDDISSAEVEMVEKGPSQIFWPLSLLRSPKHEDTIETLRAEIEQLKVSLKCQQDEMRRQQDDINSLKSFIRN